MRRRGSARARRRLRSRCVPCNRPIAHPVRVGNAECRNRSGFFGCCRVETSARKPVVNLITPMSAQPLSQLTSPRSVPASRLVTLLLLVSLAVVLSGCGPKITVTWDSPKPGVRKDTKLCLAGVEVGHVTEVRSEFGRFIAEARIDRKRATDVKSESTFLVREAQGTTPAYVEVIAPATESPPVRDGAILHGSDSETGAQLRTLVGSWKPSALLVAFGVIVLAVFARLFTRIAATIFCLGAGLAGACFGTPYAAPYLARWVPAEYRPDLLAYGIGFLVAYLIALLAVSLLRAPGAAARQ